MVAVSPTSKALLLLASVKLNTPDPPLHVVVRLAIERVPNEFNCEPFTLSNNAQAMLAAPERLLLLLSTVRNGVVDWLTVSLT
jgi:hypothetical protein